MSFITTLKGLTTNLTSHIDNQLGLYALTGIFLLILIYLIRPKPLQKTIPSLLFLMKDTGKSKKESFFQKLLRDFLLIFHFLLVAILAVSAMQPFFLSNEDVSKDHTVLVIDTSASMNVADTSLAGGTLFDQAISKAKSYVDGKISIVIVDNDPLVLLNQGKEEEAVEILSSLKPTQSLSSIGNSILAAGDLLAGDKGRVVVISDFVNTDSVEPIIAKKTLEAKGIHVEFVNLADSGKNNIGIIEADLSEKESKITVQNFNDKPAQFEVEMNGEKQAVALMPGMNQKLTFLNKEGDNKVRILQNDDLSVDNEVHIFTPVKKKVKVLLITNEEKSYILPALSAYKLAWNNELEIETAEPPKMPPIDHDLIILGPVDPSKLPSGSLDTVKRLVEKKGSSLIITGFPELHKLKVDKLLPVELDGLANKPTEVFNLQTLNDITKDLSFSKTENYYLTKSVKGAITLATAQDNSTVIAFAQVGDGNVAYYGIFDAQSKFKFDISYPIFWQQLIDYMINAETINTLNYKVGSKLMFDNELDIITPTKKLKTSSLEFNEVGPHIVRGKKVYVNLLNAKESDVNFVASSESAEGYEGISGTENVKKRLITYFIYAIIAILFLELMYIKVRGDL
jgi:hypothetical protein